MSRSEVNTVLARCREIGLDATQASGTGATLSAASLKKSARELPRISVDLQTTLAPPRQEKLEAGGERDLEVLSVLGEGGMGRVLLARQHSLDREVAIKTLRSTASEREHAALVSEGAITGHLEHPSIIPVHALGLDAEGHPVLVMKRVEGVEWTELIAHAQHEVWGEDTRDRQVAHLEILMQVCNAAHFAHSRNIVHRDIKPQNVLIGRYGDVYLGDWGLAVRVDRPWTPQPLCGTPAYMAPEMVVGGEVDARTDVYLLGATLHHILTGEGRNGGLTACDALVGAIDPTPFAYAPAIPERLAAIANRATTRDPAARFQSALELKQALAQYLDHRSSIALAESALTRLKELRERIHSGDPADEATQQEIDRLSVEARFALLEAKKQWGDNPAAAEGLKELDELLAARRARAAELERMARDLDPTVGARWRAFGFAALALIGAALSALAFLDASRFLSPRMLFFHSLPPLACVLLVSILLRRRLFGTAFNRRIVLAIFSVTGGITFSRTIGLAAGLSVPQILLQDMVMTGIVSLICALYMFRWIAWGALFLLGGAVVTAFHPEYALQVFALGSGLSLILFAWLAWRTAGR